MDTEHQQAAFTAGIGLPGRHGVTPGKPLSVTSTT
jgi:hypothetical protein